MRNRVFVSGATLVVLLLALAIPSQSLAALSISNCPGPRTFSHCGAATLDFVATADGINKPVTWAANLGTVVSTGDSTAVWSWNTMPQAGFPTLQIIATDQAGVADTCTVELTITNAAPSIACPSKVTCIPSGDCGDVTITATDDCDPLWWGYEAPFDFQGTITVNNGVYHICPYDYMFQEYTLTAIVSDGLVETSCEFKINTALLPPPVAIDMIDNQAQGQYADVDLTLERNFYPWGIGGFDFLLAYDNSVLFPASAYEGDVYGDCGWEYFSYRLGARGDFGDACPSGLIRLVGTAEIDNGPHHPTCGVADAPVTLTGVRFLVSNDLDFQCQFVPISFFWTGCGDNVLSAEGGNQLYLSAGVFDHDNQMQIDDDEVGFPTYLGTQRSCVENQDTIPHPVRYLYLYNGGIDIACPDPIIARGDLNLNGIPYETADAIMYGNYFVEGLTTFGPFIEDAIAASDVNADGCQLSLADLVYLMRVIVGDASPHSKTTPVMAGYAFENGAVSIDAEMGAAYLVFEGSVTPTLLAPNMKMKVGEREGRTHVLVYSDGANQTFSGVFLQTGGTLVRSEFATYEGQAVVAKPADLPKSFTLHQNYPNPFNPTTTISFELPQAADVTLDVFNLSGQHVATLVSQRLEAGVHTAEWDASGYASGIYLYRLQAGAYTGTRKMVLLK